MNEFNQNGQITQNENEEQIEVEIEKIHPNFQQLCKKWGNPQHSDPKEASTLSEQFLRKNFLFSLNLFLFLRSKKTLNQ